MAKITHFSILQYCLENICFILQHDNDPKHNILHEARRNISEGYLEKLHKSLPNINVHSILMPIN